jgi:membrane protein
MRRLAEWLAFAKTVTTVMYEPEIKYPAAALAYYAFVSFIPLLLLVLAVFGRQVAVEVYSRLPRFVTPNAQQLIYESLTTASGRTGAAVLAVVVLAWGGANVAVGFLTVVRRAEGLTEQPLSGQVRDGAVVLGTLTLAMLAIVLLSMLSAVFSAGPVGVLAGFVVLLVVLTGTLVPLYYVPSRVMASPSSALPGALATAFGWTVLHAAIRVYSANATQYAIYGVLSGIIIILTAIYLAAVSLMMGVVVNAVLATDGDALPGDSPNPT